VVSAAWVECGGVSSDEVKPADAVPRRWDDPLRFSLWLPFFSVVVWLTMVVWPILDSFIGLLPSKGLGPEGGRLSYLFLMALHYGAWKNADVIQAVSLPGVFVEALISAVLMHLAAWHPSTMPLKDWRALTLPFFCLPFWWFLGIGIEGLVRVRTLRWPFLTLGTVLSLSFLGVCAGFLFGQSAADRQSTFGWTCWGFGLWGLLFVVFPVAWIRNRRKKAAAA
jgi:hypothetical protein